MEQGGEREGKGSGGDGDEGVVGARREGKKECEWGKEMKGGTESGSGGWTRKVGGRSERRRVGREGRSRG